MPFSRGRSPYSPVLDAPGLLPPRWKTRLYGQLNGCGRVRLLRLIRQPMYLRALPERNLHYSENSVIPASCLAIGRMGVITANHRVPGRDLAWPPLISKKLHSRKRRYKASISLPL